MKLTHVPTHLQFLRLYLNLNLVEVDVESDNLTEACFESCYNLKSVKIKAPLSRFVVDDDQLEYLSVESKASLIRRCYIPLAHINAHEQLQFLKVLEIVSHVSVIELLTPR